MSEITNEERALLMFPGSVPGVLRRGSPLSDGSCIIETVNDRGDVWFAGGPCDDYGDLAICRAKPEQVSLDLTDATGRAHLQWWWRSARLEGPGWWVSSPEKGGGYGIIGLLNFDGLAPLLSELDPDDPRLLPDGSRLVDALALALVARHVAGVE